MNDQYLFQYCQKLVIFSSDRRSVLFARRSGEAEFDNYWSLIGGKMDVSDPEIIDGIAREKNEEVGENFRIRVAPQFSCYNVLFKKKDGASMILPHLVAVHVGGEVALNPGEYSTHKWVALDELPDFGPKIDNTMHVIQNAARLLPLLKDEDFVEL
jgi:ADP-ribose pyrophosphatase YjhB (NUDIX family)